MLDTSPVTGSFAFHLIFSNTYLLFSLPASFPATSRNFFSNTFFSAPSRRLPLLLSGSVFFLHTASHLAAAHFSFHRLSSPDRSSPILFPSTSFFPYFLLLAFLHLALLQEKSRVQRKSDCLTWGCTETACHC